VKRFVAVDVVDAVIELLSSKSAESAGVATASGRRGAVATGRMRRVFP
jgi:hypothetical protein